MSSRLKHDKKWVLKPQGDREDIRALAEALSIDPILSGLLVQRGVRTFEEAKEFFRPSLDGLHDPFLMQDMAQAIDRIQKTLDRGGKIMVYGDYDVDGTTSVALVYSFLNRFTDELIYYIPNRYEEGYGVSFQGVDKAAAEGCELIIALDCGIKAHEKVTYAKEQNIDFIICDHHRPGESLPDAVAVLDPKREDCTYPYDELSGCCIGFKLVQALATVRNIPFEEIAPLLDLVVVSIAADIVPITGENRVLAYYGLQRLNEAPRIGLKALMSFGKKKSSVSITDVVFQIAPRINAAGRIESGLQAVQLLLSDNELAAMQVGHQIDQHNIDRRSLDDAIGREALRMIEADKQLQKAKSTVLFQPDWHKGVIGIVASRLIEKYYRPTIILTKSNGKLTGSARSIKGFDIYAALEECSDLLEQFGGHKYAAGLTMEHANIADFKKRFEEVVARELKDDQLIPEVHIDAELALDQITGKFYRVLKQMGPFGPGNMKPVFKTMGLKDTGWGKIVGEDHLKLNVRQDQSAHITFPLIAFGQGKHYNLAVKRQAFDMVYSIDENEWNGEKTLQLVGKDLRFFPGD